MTLMEIGYYGFAFFVFILVCLLMILYNYLFSDMKRQKKLLDEKENKLLRLYQSVEEALDDFHDSVEGSHGEITQQLRELGELHAEVERGLSGAAAHAPSRIERVDAPRSHPAAPVAARPAPVQPTAEPPAQAIHQEPVASLADSIGQAANIRALAPPPVAPSAAAAPAPATPVASADSQMAPPPVFRQVMEAVMEVEPPAVPAAPARNEQILRLTREGRSSSQIAKELGITLSEVELVIGMSR